MQQEKGGANTNETRSLVIAQRVESHVRRTFSDMDSCKRCPLVLQLKNDLVTYGNSTGSIIAVTWTKWTSSRGTQWRQINRWRRWRKPAFHWDYLSIGVEGGKGSWKTGGWSEEYNWQILTTGKNINSFHFCFLTPYSLLLTASSCKLFTIVRPTHCK